MTRDVELIIQHYASLRAPSLLRGGDYLTVRRHYPHTRLIASTGYILKSGTGEQDSTACYTVFGRRDEVDRIGK